MAAIKPYYTTLDLIESVKLRIMYPISQNALTFNNLVKMMNEELQLSAVPSVRELHEEFFVFKKLVPLVNGINVYAIPDRAQGMVLRDLFWSDENGNYIEMTRVAPEDKAYFQQHTNSNTSITKYYLEGNNVILTPEVSSGATGKLNFTFYIRPNYLVRDDRACIIQNFVKPIVITNNSLLVDGDTITITLGNKTPSQNNITLTARNVVTNQYEFLIDTTASLTAFSLNNTILNLGIEGLTSNITNTVVNVSYEDISATYSKVSNGINIDNNHLYIQFDQLPSTYTDPETDITENLYTVNCKVDFLKTLPGHDTYAYDVKLRQVMSGNIGKFKVEEMQTFLSNTSAGKLQFVNLVVGDYMCLQNECIIPQLPPELHNALAERTAARVLSALGDKEAYAIAKANIAEMDKQQATLIGQRVSGSVPKVFNTKNLLRLGKGNGRRF